MAFTRPDWDWILDRIEDRPFGKFHIGVGLTGAATAAAIGVEHLLHPEVLGRLHYWSTAGALLVFIIGVAPAFAAALAFGQLLNPTAGGSDPGGSGPMSSYILQERESRKWKLRVAAAAVGAANYLFLFLTAVPPPNGFS